MMSSPSEDESSLSFLLSLAALDLVLPFLVPPPADEAPVVPAEAAAGVVGVPVVGVPVAGDLSLLLGEGDVRELEEFDLRLIVPVPKWTGFGGRGGASSTSTGSDFAFIERSTNHDM